MGITGLLSYLEDASRPCNIKEFQGRTIAIDSYCWLHRAASVHALAIAKGGGIDNLVAYCMSYIKLFLSHNIKPIMVFDGKPLPAKACTTDKRREGRDTARQTANEFLKLGNIEEAKKYFQRSVSITQQMTTALIKKCQNMNIDCIIAPYEADAQLAYLSKHKVADVVITEDSDLMLFGCHSVIYKFDTNGNGLLIEQEKIPLCMNIKYEKYSFDKFVYMCILSGCDYLPSLPGIGLKKAEKFMKITDENDPLKFLGKIPRYLNMQKLEISEQYIEDFMMAVATFKHQVVFDPMKKELVFLTDPETEGTPLKYCKNAGSFFENTEAFQMAIGNKSYATGDIINNWIPDDSKSDSIWSRTYTPRLRRKVNNNKELPTKKSNETTQGLCEDIMKNESDKKIAEELGQYFSKSTKRKITETDINLDSDVEEDRISPVIFKNPFMKKSKISKFTLTDEQNTVVVQSRFFSSPQLTASETAISEVEEVKGYSIIEHQTYAESNKESIPPDIQEDIISEVQQEVISSDIIEYHTSTQSDIEELVCSPDIQEEEDYDNVENTPNNCVVTLLDTSSSICLGNKTYQNTSSNKIAIQHSASKVSSRKSTARTVGLSRKQKVGQASILHFFKSSANTANKN